MVKVILPNGLPVCHKKRVILLALVVLLLYLGVSFLVGEGKIKPDRL